MGGAAELMATVEFENLMVYQPAEKLADEIWSVVCGWDHFAKATLVK